MRAEVYLHQKDTTAAAKSLDESLKLDPYDYDAWRTRGLISLGRQQWREADEFIGKAIHLKPKIAENYVNRALARLNYNNLRGAMDDYDNAIVYDPNNFLAHYNRALLRMNLGDDNRAITDFDFIIKMEPKNFIAIYNRAILNDRTGQIRAAIRDYSKVIEQFPNFWTGLAQRARCYRKLGMTAKAELDEFRIFKAQMNKHIGIQPRWSKNKRKEMRKRSEIDLDKYNQIVVADDGTPSEGHEYKSEYRGKVQNRSVEIAFLPMYQMSYFHQETVGADRAFDKDIEELNRLSKAEKTVFLSCTPSQMTEQQSLSMFNYIDKLSKSIGNVKDVDVMSRQLMLRAIAYSALQDFESAINDLTAVIQMNDKNRLAYWQRAVCEEMQSNYNTSQGISNQLIAGQTRADFDDAIRLNPNNPYLYYNRGNMHASRKEYSQAIDDYSKAIEMDGRMAEAWYNRGIARVKSQNKTQGISDLSKAGELGLFDAYSIIKRITVK